MVLSIGIFFTLIILGLAATLPSALLHGLTAQGVPAADAARVAALRRCSATTRYRCCSAPSSPTWPRPAPPT